MGTPASAPHHAEGPSGLRDPIPDTALGKPSSSPIWWGFAFDDLTLQGIGDVAVAPGDVATDHIGLVAVTPVVRVVAREVGRLFGLGLDPVQPCAVERHGGQFDVVRPVPDLDAANRPVMLTHV